jgi:molybdopterin-guanine dinucleotide biosynthesis protein A
VPEGRIAGLVLAGGTSRRMGGVDKAWQPWQGQPLVLHTAQRLRAQLAPNAPLLVSANQHRERYAQAGWQAVADVSPWQGQGPLAGILSGLRALLALEARTDWLLVTPCDVPNFPDDLLARLQACALASAAPATYACTPQRQHFGSVLLRTEGVARRLHALLVSGERRLESAWHQLGCAGACFDDEAAFANLNTQQDWGSAQAAARPGSAPT